MAFKTFTRREAESAMQKFSSGSIPSLDAVNQPLRVQLESFYHDLECDGITDLYDLDVKFGLKLYNYLSSLDFTNRDASDSGFWRYLSVAVIPHIVKKRWGLAEDHFWKKPSRIWLSSIWWYIHLSWQGSFEETEKILFSSNFTTDSILNLVERTGRDGTNVQLYRRIMFYQSKITHDSQKVFRAIMKLNTATSLVVEPGLCENGIDGYVKSLYNEVGVYF